MDFFARQDAARGRTRRLVGLFALAVAAIVAAVYLAVRLLIYKYGDAEPEGGGAFFQPEIFGWVAAITLAVILVGSIYKVLVLRQGGEAIARLLGGRPLEPNTTDLAERRLLNVVEEMALAAGLRPPPVFVLDKEEGINAFAAGFAPADAVLGVTRGAVQQLKRDELQGVIGHELSHVINGDMRLNLRLIGLLHGIFVIALIGYWILRGTSGGRSSGGKKGGGGAILLFGLALLAIGGIGLFFGRLIKAAVSRQREFLADAAAVQFTRHPAGLAGALARIGGRGAQGAKLASANAEQASHLYFADGMGKRWLQLFSTHPPLAARIRALDPSFTGDFGDAAPESVAEAFAELTADATSPAGAGVARAVGARSAPTQAGAAAGPHAGGVAATAAAATAASVGAPVAGGPAAAPRRIAVDAAGVTAQIGRLQERHLAYATALLGGLPPGLREAAREPLTAQAVVLALLLDKRPEVRAHQLAALTGEAPPELAREGTRLAALVDAAPAEARLPLVDLSLPALRRLSAAQYQRFSGLVDRLVAADARVGLFELTLQRLLRRHLATQFTASRPPKGDLAPSHLAGEHALLLSALAWCGHETQEEAQSAVAAGAALLPALRDQVTLRPLADCGLSPVDQALERLSRLTLQGKRALLGACVTAVAADGRITVEESELLRAVADALDLPMPPLAAGQAA